MDTNSIGKIIGGQVTDGSTGVEYGTAGKCITDVFTISGTMGVPPICGDISGEHSRFLTI